MPGVISLQGTKFSSYEQAQAEIGRLQDQLKEGLPALESIVMIVLCDDSPFTAANLRNYLWVTYTRCNPSHDIYGVDSSVVHKHWGCKGPLIIDARIKPHHAPVLEKDPAVEKNIDRLFARGGSLAGL
jgi:4-hydroxy-3-polyprenylbenzoate decarboxylase